MSGDFTSDQKRYLEGFVSGIQAGASPAVAPSPRPSRLGPDAPHLKAQDETVARAASSSTRRNGSAPSIRSTPTIGLKAQASRGEYPKPEDNFRWRYFGLFYVAPAQNSYMCRLRIPNGILTHWQLPAWPTWPSSSAAAIRM